MTREDSTGDRFLHRAGGPIDEARAGDDSREWQRDSGVACRLRAVAAGFEDLARELREEAERLTFGGALVVGLREKPKPEPLPGIARWFAAGCPVMRCTRTERSEAFQRRCTRDSGHVGSCLFGAWEESE